MLQEVTTCSVDDFAYHNICTHRSEPLGCFVKEHNGLAYMWYFVIHKIVYVCSLGFHCSFTDHAETTLYSIYVR